MRYLKLVAYDLRKLSSKANTGCIKSEHLIFLKSSKMLYL